MSSHNVNQAFSVSPQPSEEEHAGGGIPEFLKALAVLLTAIAGLITALYAAGVLKGFPPSGAEVPAPTGAAVSLSPSSLDFGQQQVGTRSYPRTIIVTSTGTESLTVQNASVTGTDPQDFHITSNDCNGASLPHAGSCTISVSFSPTSSGPRDATLAIRDNASNSPQQPSLSGTGGSTAGPTPPPPPPPPAITPTNLNFSTQESRTTSQAKTVTVTNLSGTTLSITNVAFTGDQPQDFDKSTDTCLGASLDQGRSCIISVAFAPTAEGDRTADLTIIDNATNSPQRVPLKGVGLPSTGTLTPTITPGIGEPTTGTTPEENSPTASATPEGGSPTASATSAAVTPATVATAAPATLPSPTHLPTSATTPTTPPFPAPTP